MNKVPNKSYREIEVFDVQVFSTKFDIYKIYSEYMVECGHYKCINFILNQFVDTVQAGLHQIYFCRELKLTRETLVNLNGSNKLL